MPPGETSTEVEAPAAAAAPADPLLARLAEDLRAVAFVEGTPASPRLETLLDRARRLVEIKLAFEAARGPDAPPLVVIAGGTNVGKSTTFNWIVGEAIASSSPLARHTKAPTVFVHRSGLEALANGAFLPAYRRIPLEDPLAPTKEMDAGGRAYFLLAHERDEAREVVLIDSPDIDSTHARNRAVAEDLLFLADTLLFVSTPEKYNDQLCVTYLRQAVELGKALVCVLNKGADEEVARDFREVVVPGLEGEDVVVLTLPYVTPKPDPATEAPFRAQLRAAALQPPAGWAAQRERARRGAALRVSADLEELTSRLREELSELDRIRSEVELALDRQRDAYEATLRSLEFYELDRVFERVLAEFRVPVLDDAYDLARGAAKKLQGLWRSGSGPRPDARALALEERASKEQQKVKELLEGARTACLEATEERAGALGASAAAWLADLQAKGVEALNADVERFVTQADAQAERWITDQTAHHVNVLKDHPYARNALRTIKGVFQVGFGLLSIKLTGGFGPWDLLIGPATERATKVILESVGGYVHYQTLHVEFCRARAALFRETLAEAVQGPLLARLPRGVEPEVLDRLTAAAVELRGRS